MQQLLWFLVTIGILIPIHEYGHYRVAVACNVKVLRFSVGFGRVLWSRRFGKDGTEFALSMIPLGGYVKMVHEADEHLAPGEAHRALNNRPLAQRAAVLAAGPLANLLLAVVLFAFVQWYGVEAAAPVASTPFAGSLMAEAGLRAQDRILAVAAGESPGEDDWRDVRSLGEVYDALSEALMERRPVQLRVTHPGEAGVHTLKVAVDTLDPDQLGAGTARRIGLGSPFAPPRIGEVVAGSPAAL
ncbi:MAG TPA: site-2 protease family protein, partial [Burkholderiaceae bacterium]